MADEKKEKFKLHEDEKEFEHESYGMVGFSRMTGDSGRLFGSALPNQGTFIRLRLTKGIRRHALGRDWYHGELESMFEVDLSSAQFAELLTGMNVGSGIPCTIRRLMGKEMGDPPDELLEAEQVKHDFKDKTDQVGKKLEKYRQRIEDLLDKKNITQADRKEILSALSMIVQDVRSNLPFWLDQFHEATGKIVSAAKAEVDSFMTHALVVAGRKALGLSEGNESPFRELPPQLPPAEKK